MAGIGAASNGGAARRGTPTSRVESADATVAKVEAAGGTTLLAPFDFGAAGRMAVFADPEGAVFRVWQAGEAGGAELVNAPGAWNWSDLETRDIAAAKAFYAAVFGWEYQDVDFGSGPSTMIRVPGYGDHLEALNPGTLASHKEIGAPGGLLGRDRLDATALEPRRPGPLGRHLRASPTPTPPPPAPRSSAAPSSSSRSTSRTRAWPSSATPTA